MKAKLITLIFTLTSQILLNNSAQAQTKADVYRFSADEKDVQKLYDAIAKGGRPIPNTDQSKTPRLKDQNPMFHERGDWEAQMFEQIEEMKKQMQHFFDRDQNESNHFPPTPKFFPKNFGLKQMLDAEDPITTKENKNNTVYSIDLNKVDPNSLKIEIKSGQVSIAGESRIENKESGPNTESTSVSITSFNRSFPLPSGVKESAVKIEQKDKVIEILIPKA